MKYYYIEAKYLRRIFSIEKLKMNKYISRPFIHFEINGEDILIPCKTIHNTKHSNNKFYEYIFNDNKTYISLSNLIFVPKKFIYEAKKLNFLESTITRMKEVEENFEYIKKKISLILKFYRKIRKFRKLYGYIGESKKHYLDFIKTNKTKFNKLISPC